MKIYDASEFVTRSRVLMKGRRLRAVSFDNRGSAFSSVFTQDLFRKRGSPWLESK
ncbi:MAG: hypothetical protein ETSY2_04960 [Candidatus Entotheonella gemina]|uniref:Uncharacterized protein n=1 Tax=Candidatus Entotheonella gemina TaxID=1429439 RepID=W4MEA6_9BACT|nr:MAG: hypothetical protein ETSY2_04960 [Candidatus Entotheonella gemina]